MIATIPAAASGAEPVASCGYAFERTLVQAVDGGVPLLFRQLELEPRAQSYALSQRNWIIEHKASHEAACPKTAAYLRRILDRLIDGSGLEAFARSAPEVALVLECDGASRLPVARAAAGKILVVPRALPRLATSEDAIAAVLAHELAHLTLRHVERLIASVPPGRDAAQHARELKTVHEREADITGLKILANAGYDPLAAIEHLRLVQVLATQSGAAPRNGRRRRTHDDADARAHRMTAQIRSCGYPVGRRRRPVEGAIRGELAGVGMAPRATLPSQSAVRPRDTVGRAGPPRGRARRPLLSDRASATARSAIRGRSCARPPR